MAAPNAATLETARRRADAAARMLDMAGGPWWADQIRAALAGPSTHGSLRKRMEAPPGQDVETLQVTVRLRDGELAGYAGLWTPGHRAVDASRATRVILDGSQRDYAGVTTTAATDTVYVGFAKWGDDVQLIVYATE